MKTAIVTGISGQDGSHLSELLLDKGYEVWGVVRRSSTDTSERYKHLMSHRDFHVIEGDITDYSSIINILRTPEHVDEFYSLAAQSHVGTSFKQPALTWDITGNGVLNILQALLDLNMMTTRFYQASSSEMFGSEFDIASDGTKYQNEDTKLMPNSPYAIAKTAAHHAVRIFRDAYDLHGSCGILFNHEGPRRGDNFVTKKITNWIWKYQDWMKKLELKESDLDFSYDDEIIVLKDNKAIGFDKLRLGNLEACRDWGYAGDYVEAMWMMLQQDYADDYVICTGKTASIKEFLELCSEESGVCEYSNWVYIDPEFYRPSEVEYLRGDCTKAREKLGWTPKHDLRSLVRLMLER